MRSPLGLPRFLISLVFACLCATVLYSRVYDDFERIRFRVVTAERAPSQGTIIVTLPDLSRLFGQPVAIVLRLDNASLDSRRVRVSINGTALATVPLSPKEEIRVDLSLPTGVRLTEGNQLELSAEQDGWFLRSLELGNAHGFNRGLFHFVIVPAAAQRQDVASLLVSLLVCAALLAFPRAPFSAMKSRALRLAYVVITTLVLLLLTATLLASFVSDYAVLLSLNTWVSCAAILYFPSLKHVGEVVWHLLCERRFLLLYLTAFTLFFASIGGFYETDNGFTSLIRFGDTRHHQALPAVRTIPHHVENSAGYDGQFYAQLAVDPLLLDPAIDEALDSPAYRGRRILFSWTAFLLGLGQPRFVLQAYAMQNVIF